MLSVARVLALVGALCMVALGLLVGGLGLLVGLSSPAAEALATAAMAASFLALTVCLGLAMAWQAWQAMQGKSSRTFQPRWPWIAAIVFLLVVLLGQAVLSLDVLPVVLFPPFHVTGAVLPALIVVAAVGRALGQVTRWREVVLQVSSGALLSTLLAFILEVAVVLGLIFLVVLSVAARPNGLELVESALTYLQDPAWVQDPANLAVVVKSPIFLAAAFLIFAGIIPVLEELVKTVGVGLMATYRRPSLAQSFLWGAAGGAGFALAEGLFNSLGGLNLWAAVVLLRVGATMLHTFTGGLMGLAWFSILAERRWLRALGLYAVSVVVHGVWNALAAGMSLISLSGMSDELTAAGQSFIGMGVMGLLSLLLLLALLILGGLAGLAHYVRGRTQPLQVAGKDSAPVPALLPTDPSGSEGSTLDDG